MSKLSGLLVRGFLLAPLLGAVAPMCSAQAQEAWRGLTVPKYGNATDYAARADGLNPLGETVNYGQLGCVIALGCCAAAQGSLDSNSIGDK